MYIHINAHMHVHIMHISYVSTCSHIHTYPMCMHMCISFHIHTCTYTQTHAYTYAKVQLWWLKLGLCPPASQSGLHGDTWAPSQNSWAPSSSALKPLGFMIASQRPGGFPGGPVVKNLPYSAEDVGLIPGQGTKIPHAAG